MWNNDSVVLYFYIGMAILAMWAVSQAWRSQANTETIHPFKAFVHLLAFYLSYLLPPLVFFSVYAGIQGYYSIHEAIFVFLVSAVLSYARFIEPNVLIVKETHIKSGYDLKIALISDMHYGLYSTPWQMQRLVNKLNTLEVDMVLVAGDWTYEPAKNISLTEQLAPFKQLKHPIYSVPGNHDEELPGPPLAKELKQALIDNHIRPIEATTIDLGKVRLVGLADLLPPHTRISRLNTLNQQDKPLLLLTHNPESLEYLPKLTQPFVMLAGHTHGGQVNLPILTEKILHLLTEQGYKRGVYPLENNNQLFITSGIGMVGLPLRFAMPPTIDILNFY